MRIRKEDARSVLRAGIAALPVQGSRVDGFEIELKQQVQIHLRRIKCHAHRFRKPRASRADLLIIGACPITIRIAGLRFHDAAHLFEIMLDAPKTAAGEVNDM